MKRKENWSAERALTFYRRLALDGGDDFLTRSDWVKDTRGGQDTPGYSLSEIDSIYTEIINKIPAGATKVLEIGCGNGRFYQALKAARPGLAYRGIDIVPENIIEAQTARGAITCAGVQGADTVTINGVTLTASASQTASGLDFDEFISVDGGSNKEQLVASSLVAAINDAGNGLSGTVTASNQGGESTTVVVRSTATGTAGNAITLASSEGTRLAINGATLTTGEDPGLFELGNALEYLSEAPEDWDFVVSIGCLFFCGDTREPNLAFDMLNAKSPLGFFVLADSQQAGSTWLTGKMTAAEAASANVAESYYDGARAFLDDGSLLQGETHPFYLHRDSTAATAPFVPPRYRSVTTGRLNTVLDRQETTRALLKGAAAPANITGFISSGGLITGMGSRAVPAEITADLSKFVRP